MSYKDNVSGWSRRSGRHPVYHAVSNQEDSLIYDISYTDENEPLKSLPLAAAEFKQDYIDPNSNTLNDVHEHRVYELQHDDGVKKQGPDHKNCIHVEKESFTNPHERCCKGVESTSVASGRSISSNYNSQHKNPTLSEYSKIYVPLLHDDYADSAHQNLPFPDENSFVYPTCTDKLLPTPLVESTATKRSNVTSVIPQHDSTQIKVDLDPTTCAHSDICNALPLQVHELNKDNYKVGLSDRGNSLTSAGSQTNITSDVSDRNSPLQDSRETTVSHLRSNPTLTHNRVNRTTLPTLSVVKETPSSSTPGVVQASHGNSRGDNYFVNQGDNSQLVASLDVPEITKQKFVLPESSSSTDNQSQIKSMDDPAVLERNGQKLGAVTELELNGSVVHENRETNDHKNPNKKKGHMPGVTCNNKVGNGVVVGDVKKDNDDSGSCGWGKFKFDLCQKFRDAKWFLVVLTMCGACQGMAVNGFVNTVISTVERRYEISSTESGLIASCYDIMFVILVIPISYFGGLGHKPRYLGIGIFVLGVGSFVFALPHFISGNYYVENADETVCKLHHNVSSLCSTQTSTSLSNYKYFFYLGQLLHGAGATPLYTLGVTFMDENVPQRSSAFYNGIFYTGAIIGPAIGYMVGAKFLDFYIDVTVDPKSLGLDPNNPKWVGAWWIGFLISGVFGVLLSLPLLAFPSGLPGSSKYALERGKETQASKHVDQSGKHRGFKDILLSLKYLLTNIPFMFINIAAAADGILVAGFSTFMPKFIEYEYGLSAGTAALYVGLCVVPAGGGATFAGGFIVKCFNLKMRGILRLCTIMSFILCALAVALLMECDTTPFAGVTLPYGQTDVGAATFLGKKLEDTCNQDCGCAEEDFYPVCGRDKVLYFSPCYAGCKDVSSSGSIKRYANCSCINYNLTTSNNSDSNIHLAEFGKCEFNCKWLILFLFLFGFMIVFVFITSMPSLTATLRCVPDHQRSFGLGIQWIVARCLGSIPGPILFGKMFDFACLVWQKRCSGDGSCFFYDTHKLSLYLLALALAFAMAAAVSFLLALCFYKVKEAEDEAILQIIKPSPMPSHKAAVSYNDASDLLEVQISQNDSAINVSESNGTDL